MSSNHMLELPNAVWNLKIAQAVIALLVLALAAFNVSLFAYGGSSMAIFTSLYSGIIIVYFFVAVHSAHQVYNWLVLLITEISAVIFWLSTWSSQASLYAIGFYYSTYGVNYYTYDDDDYYDDLSKRAASVLAKRGSVYSAYGPVLIASIVFSVVQFILYCVTLFFISRAVHRHRKANRPMQYHESGLNGSAYQPKADV